MLTTLTQQVEVDSSLNVVWNTFQLCLLDLQENFVQKKIPATILMQGIASWYGLSHFRYIHVFPQECPVCKHLKTELHNIVLLLSGAPITTNYYKQQGIKKSLLYSRVIKMGILRYFLPKCGRFQTLFRILTQRFTSEVDSQCRMGKGNCSSMRNYKR